MKSAGMVSTGKKRQCRSFNDNPKCAERQAVLRKRLCEYDRGPVMVVVESLHNPGLLNVIQTHVDSRERSGCC